MFSFRRRLTGPARRARLGSSLLAASVLLALSAGVEARQAVPQNLGYGLDKLVESRLATRSNAAEGRFNGYTTEAAANYAASAITEAGTGRVLIDVTLSGRVPFEKVRDALAKSAPAFTVTAVDKAYRSTGIIEGYVSLDDVAAVAQTEGVRAVFLGLKPETNRIDPTEQAAADKTAAPEGGAQPGDVLKKLGIAFDQGVTQHRVDRINQYYNPNAPVNYDGQGITIGAMSDSFDMATAAPHAAADVASFDLPGAAGHPLNTQPVVVLAELGQTGTDEGRAMVQILHKMAPRARLGFGTGAGGEVLFGNTIRALAGMPGFTLPPEVQQGFKADVIVDDLSIEGEPFWGESIVGNAIDDAAAFGVAYFSSAGNNVGINSYESTLRLVPNGSGNTAATNTALAGTNIDLTGVPAGLYAGGFHNFNPVPGQLDVAQLVNMPAATTTGKTEMQWDDPYDQRDVTPNEPPVFSTTGNIGAAGTPVTFDGTSTPPLPTFTQGTAYVIDVRMVSGDFDAILQVYDPNGVQLFNQDTGTDELISFFAPISGQYKIVVNRYDTTTGDFSIKVSTASRALGVTTDLNLLVFRADTGAYISARSLTSNNFVNNRPVEIGTVVSPTGQTQIQFVIARANVPNANQVRPTRVRWSTRGNGAAGIGPAEYFTYNATTSKGHASAKGGNGTAAYSVFRPNIPEAFTSPGPALILFDKDANRLAVPELRQIPRVAAGDNANTTFFASTNESPNDPDTLKNFSGTSAAAPHAAGIAALVLQSRGGPGSVTPAQLRTILQKSAFPHDLDPSFASGTAYANDGGGVTISILSDNDNNTSTGLNDPASIKVSYLGPGSLATLVFNPAGTGAQGGNVTGGNNGVIDNPGSSPATVTYFANDFPGLVFVPATKPFTLGPLVGLTAADIVAPLGTAPWTGFSNLAPPPANGTTQFFTMSLSFPNANFSDGKSVSFTVGRGAAHSAATGDTGTIGPGTVTLNPIADLFGGGVSIPSGVQINDGMTFSGTTSTGATFTGTIKNKIGAGWSPVDGYGFINAEVATDRIFANGFE